MSEKMTSAEDRAKFIADEFVRVFDGRGDHPWMFLYSTALTQIKLAETASQKGEEGRMTWPEIPTWMVNPLVFMDANLGIVLVSGKDGEQWIHRILHGKWVTVRAVDGRDGFKMVEALNLSASPAPTAPAREELTGEKLSEIALCHARSSSNYQALTNYARFDWDAIAKELNAPAAQPIAAPAPDSSRELHALICNFRNMAENCLNCYEMNPRAASDELHTKETYVDLLKLCDLAATATGSRELREPTLIETVEKIKKIIASTPGAVEALQELLDEHKGEKSHER